MPSARKHLYETEIVWTGNRGTGTSTYRAYDRTLEITAAGTPPIPGSADPAFRGDPARWNPEQLLLAALSQCHLLSYLHVCTVNGVVVTGYSDRASGTMEETGGGSGHFTEVVLRPAVEVASAEMVEKARSLHGEAQRLCFIANSVNFPVRHEPSVTVTVAATAADG
jgi:organic hydroperoxide reductase OsmC/OhrA